MTRSLKTRRLPVELGFRMPAEWEPHEATWIAWPHNRSDWPGKFAAIEWVYSEIVRHLHQSEPVCILVNNAAQEQKARRTLEKIYLDWTRVRFYRVPTNRVWTRDYGPLFLVSESGETAITDWKFNAWAKYPDSQLDDAVPRRIAARRRLRSWPVEANGQRLVLEGGSIDVNGRGLLLTTEECLLSTVQARNPDLDRMDLESAFRDYLGVRKVLWLDRGIAGDDTHGHVDDLARFVAPNIVVTVVEESSADMNYEPLQENLRRLRVMSNLEGEALQIVTMPMPAPVIFAGQRLPASYANFYVANERVLVPTFNDPNDRIALGILTELFPGRLVVGIHSTDLIWGLGALHCLTQQQPAPPAAG
jgi:agmatine deiminase